MVGAQQLEDVEHRLARPVVGEAAVAAHHLEQLGERVALGPARGQRTAEAEARVEIVRGGGQAGTERRLVGAPLGARAQLGGEPLRLARHGDRIDSPERTLL